MPNNLCCAIKTERRIHLFLLQIPNIVICKKFDKRENGWIISQREKNEQLFEFVNKVSAAFTLRSLFTFIIIFHFQHWKFFIYSKMRDREKERERTFFYYSSGFSSSQIANVYLATLCSWEMTWKWHTIYLFTFGPQSIFFCLVSFPFVILWEFVEVLGIYR